MELRPAICTILMELRPAICTIQGLSIFRQALSCANSTTDDIIAVAITFIITDIITVILFFFKYDYF